MRRRKAIGSVLMGAALAAVHPWTAYAAPDPTADLSAAIMTHSTAKQKPGALLDYAITVKNAGPDGARAVQLAVTVPRGVAIIGVAPEGCSEAAAGMVCRFGELKATAEINAKIAGIVKPKAAGPQTARVEVRSDTADADATNNQSTQTISVERGVDLAVRLRAPRKARPGRDFKVTARVANRSRYPARNVHLDLGTDHGHVVAASGRCAGQIRCNLGRLAPGRSKKLHFRVRAVARRQSFAATASADRGDTNPGNNTAVVTLTTKR